MDRGASKASKPRQPYQTLIPQAFTLDAIEGWALDKASRFAADRFRLTSFWDVEYVRQHVPGERKTHYAIRLAEAENYGIAFDVTSARQRPDPQFVGEDSRQILKDQQFRDDIDRTALIDLVIGHITTAPSHQVVLNKTLPDKYAFRAHLFANEAALVLRQKGFRATKRTKPLIHVAGATAGIIAALLTRGFTVTATDMSPDVVGQNLGGVTVCNETENAKFIEAADLVIITGMALPNRTLPILIKAAKRCNTSTMIWAITGKNLGQYYIQHGIDCVISDPSPFLLLPGSTRIGIWRRET